MVKPSVFGSWRLDASPPRDPEGEGIHQGLGAYGWSPPSVGLGPVKVAYMSKGFLPFTATTLSSKYLGQWAGFCGNLLIAWSGRLRLASDAQAMDELQSEWHRANADIRRAAVKFVRAKFKSTPTTPYAVRKHANDLALNLEQILEGIAERRTATQLMENFKQARWSSDVVEPGHVLGYDAAVAAGAYVRARIFSSLEMVDATELAYLLGVTRETVNQKRQKGELLALTHGTRHLRYPHWQAEPRIVDVMPRVLEALGELRPWTKYLFITQRNPSLNAASPLDVLRKGDSARVIALAAEYAESITPA